MKTLAIVAFPVLLAACSYEFSQPPFQEDELTEITKSEFGKELLSHIWNFPDLEEAGSPQESLTEAIKASTILSVSILSNPVFSAISAITSAFVILN